VFPGGTAFLLNDYNDAVVVKFLASGFRDPTYGELGIARGQTLGSGWTMARRTDGQAVIAGAAQEEIGPSHTGFTPVLVRFLANGAIDTSFGSQGRVHAPFGPVCMRVATLVFDDAGGTIAAGPAESPGADAANRCRQTTLGVFRLLPNGQVDTSFGGGLVRVPLGENVKAGPLRIGDDGSVVAVATSEDSQGAAMHLVRISNQGQFGPNTMLRVPHPAYPAGFDDFAVDYSAALFDDGDIAIGGLLGQSPPVSAVVRLQGCRALSADGTGPVCAPSAPPDDDTDTGGGTPSPDPSDDPTVFRDEGGGSLGAPAIAMLLLFGVLRFSPGRRRSRPVPPRPSPR